MAVSKQNLYDSIAQITSGYARALGHPARLLILENLEKDGPSCVQIIAQYHPISPEALSDHLKILREVQLVSWEERFPYTFYSLNERNMAKAKELLNAYLNLFQFGK